MRRAGALVQGTREVQRCPPPLGDGRRPTIPPPSSAKLPGGRGCGERRAHSPHPRTHSPRACSVRPWELPAESRASRPPPRPGLAKLGVAGRASRRRGPRLSAHWCPRPRSLPCLCSTPEASLAGSLHDWELRRGCHFPLPKARSEGGRRPGGAAACGVYLLAVRLPGARTPRGEQTGRKGVCEREDVGAHTRCHTQSPCFRSYRAVEGRGGAFHCPASFGVPTGWFDA